MTESRTPGTIGIRAARTNNAWWHDLYRRIFPRQTTLGSRASDYYVEDEVRLPPKPALIGEPRCRAEKLLTGNSVDLHAIHVLMDAGGGETGAHHSNAVSRIDEGSGEDGHHLFAPAEIRV